ncbi:MAG: tetratricopeptide repeat protein, partial [Promethearchaeota archaeon]
EGDVAMEKGDIDQALKKYGAARDMVPDNIEMKYWTAISLANVNRFEEALPLFKEIFDADENWRELTKRLPDVELLNLPKEELNKILSI